jgi:hypothetical protein
MDTVIAAPTTACHVVTMAYPGRGHINPLMNLCKILALKKKDILVTFVVTEEWLGFIGSDPKPENIRFASIPNVVPSEQVRAADMDTFVEAVFTKMEAPFERLLDQIGPLTSGIAGIFLWPRFGSCRRRRSRCSNTSIFLPKTDIFPLTSQVGLNLYKLVLYTTLCMVSSFWYQVICYSIANLS